MVQMPEGREREGGEGQWEGEESERGENGGMGREIKREIES